MTILVTGGAGFIGSNIADKLADIGYNTVVVDNLSVGKRENLDREVIFYDLDIISPDMERIFLENKIEYILHYAAQASVGNSEKKPLLDASINILGTVNLLKLAKKYKIKKFIAASSAAVYGNPVYLPVDENHPNNVLSCYALSKLTMESYIKLSGIDYIIFRFSNVYGPRQDPQGEAGVISIFIDKFLMRSPVVMHGDGNQTRDFIYVEDVVNANILAIKSGIKNEIINISTNSAVSIQELYENIRKIFNVNYGLDFTEARIGDIKDSLLDNHKAKRLLDWENKFSLQEGLKLTVESFQKKLTTKY